MPILADDGRRELARSKTWVADDAPASARRVSDSARAPHIIRTCNDQRIFKAGSFSGSAQSTARGFDPSEDWIETNLFSAIAQILRSQCAH